MDEFNSVTTQLLTLLNVSATKSSKRKWIYEDTTPVPKLNKRKSVRLSEDSEIHNLSTFEATVKELENNELSRTQNNDITGEVLNEEPLVDARDDEKEDERKYPKSSDQGKTLTLSQHLLAHFKCISA